MAELYLDTSVIASLYILDANSPRALECVRKLHDAIPCTPLAEFELKNAVQLAQFQRRISADDGGKILALIEQDLESGALARIPIHWSLTLKKGIEFSKMYSAKIGCRVIDILHVASAITLEAKKFITFDDRQRQLAKALRLRVIS